MKCFLPKISVDPVDTELLWKRYVQGLSRAPDSLETEFQRSACLS